MTRIDRLWCPECETVARSKLARMSGTCRACGEELEARSIDP